LLKILDLRNFNCHSDHLNSFRSDLNCMLTDAAKSCGDANGIVCDLAIKNEF